MFQEPNENVLIEWALNSIDDAKKHLSKNHYSYAKCNIMAAASYLQDAIHKLNEKGA